MEKITYRQLQRLSSQELVERLPVGITVDSQGIAIILSVEGYQKLLERYKQNDSQSIPLYNPQKRYNAGEKVLVQKGKRLVEVTVPELDGNGHPIYD